MLAALKSAGFGAIGLDIRADAVGNGITLDVDDFAKDLRILITVVRDIAQTEAVLFGDQNLLMRARKLDTVIISSTISPRYIKELRERIHARIALIDAPMSGAQVRAERRELSFMLGGETADLDHVQPLFDAMGNSFHRMGPLGSGMAAKVLNNLLAASNTAMTRLVLDWAQDLDLNEESLLGLMNASSGQNWFASNFNDIEFARDGYHPDNTIHILAKDIESALDVAPKGADTSIPEAVKAAILRLKPWPE